MFWRNYWFLLIVWFLTCFVFWMGIISGQMCKEMRQQMVFFLLLAFCHNSLRFDFLNADFLKLLRHVFKGQFLRLATTFLCILISFWDICGIDFGIMRGKKWKTQNLLLFFAATFQLMIDCCAFLNDF